jgi:diguanylate cyclase (GGDEF)-like protein
MLLLMSNLDPRLLAPPDRVEDAGSLAQDLASRLDVPVALLSCTGREWRFEAEAFPQARAAAPVGAEIQHAWTGIILGAVGDRSWMAMLPGTTERWRGCLTVPVTAVNHGPEPKVIANPQVPDSAYRHLFAFSRRLARELTAPALYATILRTLARRAGSDIGSLAIFSEEEQALVIAATFGYPLQLVEDVRLQPGVGLIGQAFAQRRPWLGPPPPTRTPRPRYRTRVCFAVPLLFNGDCLAVVALTDPRQGTFDLQHRLAVRTLAGVAALALARQDLQQGLERVSRLAAVDPITTLWNRRHFDDTLKAEVERARRQGQALSLLLADIDDFKRINDTRGHAAGDEVLREVADLLRSSLRLFDTCARYGGEEFAIVMPGASSEIAHTVAERVRRRVEARFRLDAPGVTVSLGAATLRADDGGDDLVIAADMALLAAKRAGKNVVKARRDDPPDSAS